MGRTVGVRYNAFLQPGCPDRACPPALEPPGMSQACRSLVLVLALVAGGSGLAASELAPATGGLSVYPPSVTLRGKGTRQRLIVTRLVDGRTVDHTREARFRSEAPAIVAVSADGVLTPVGDGTGTVTATVDGKQARATVRVVDGARFLPVTFER